MRGVALRAAVAAALAGLAVAPAIGAEKTKIQFTYKEGEKSTHDLKIVMDVTASVAASGREEASTTKTEMKLAMDVVEHAAEGSPSRLGVTFRDLSLEQSSSGPAGRIEVNSSEGEIVVTRDGSAVVDTKKKVGAEFAAGLMKEFAFLGKEGTLTLGEGGRIASVEGPDELTRFMSAEAGPSLFVLETPTDAIAVGESWKSGERSVTALRGLDFSADPIAVETTFTLQSIEERDGARVATIGVKSALNLTEGLSATPTGGGLRGKAVSIPELTRSADGTVQFDLDRGRVVDSSVSVELNVRIVVGSGEDKVEVKRTGKATIESALHTGD